MCTVDKCLIIYNYCTNSIPYSAIIGWGKYWQKVHLKGLVGKYWQTVHLKGLVGKYLANAIINKTICTYIINNFFCL